MRRFLLISLGAHAAAALLALLWLLAPRGQAAPPPQAELPVDMTPIEVVRAPGEDAAPPPTPPPAPQAPPPAPQTPPAAQAAAPPPSPDAPPSDAGLPPPPPPAPEQKQAQQQPAETQQARKQQPAPPTRPAPEEPQVRVSLGAAGLTDDVEGEDMVSPGPDPSHQNIPPRYPRDAARRGERGVVYLGVKIAPAGTVDEIEVVQSSGFPSLDEAARDAVLLWRFIPVVRDGVAQESEKLLSFNFE